MLIEVAKSSPPRPSNSGVAFAELHTIQHTEIYMKHQEAQLSPRDPRDALYQLKCCARVPLHKALNLIKKRKNLIAM